MGGTLLSVHGYNFIDSSTLLCRFTSQQIKNTIEKGSTTNQPTTNQPPASTIQTTPGRWKTNGQVECTTPPSTAVGQVLLDVTNNGIGYSDVAVPVTVVEGSEVVQVSPGFGPMSGGTNVVVTEINFAYSPSMMQCRFGGETGTPASYINSTTVVCRTPNFKNMNNGIAGSIGTSKSMPVVIVTNSGMSVSSSTFNYTYIMTARVESVAPRSAPIGQDVTTVTVQGRHFVNVSTLRCLFKDSS